MNACNKFKSSSKRWRTNNRRSVNECERSLTLNNPGIFIWKYDNLNIKAKERKKDGIYTDKIYDKNYDEGNDYQ